MFLFLDCSSEATQHHCLPKSSSQQPAFLSPYPPVIRAWNKRNHPFRGCQTSARGWKSGAIPSAPKSNSQGNVQSSSHHDWWKSSAGSNEQSSFIILPNLSQDLQADCPARWRFWTKRWHPPVWCVHSPLWHQVNGCPLPHWVPPGCQEESYNPFCRRKGNCCQSWATRESSVPREAWPHHRPTTRWRSWKHNHRKCGEESLSSCR